MAIRLPSPSPRTLIRVGGLLLLSDLPGQAGPASRVLSKRFGGRWAGPSELSRLLALGFYGSSVDAR